MIRLTKAIEEARRESYSRKRFVPWYGQLRGLPRNSLTLDEWDKAVALDPSSVDDDTLLEAARGCPARAIIVEDDQGLQLYP